MKKKEPFTRFNETAVAGLAAEHYGIHGSADPLDSYIDQNFLLTDESGEKYIFKIANPAERPEILDAQNKAMEHMAGDPTITGPRVIPTLKGETVTSVTGPSGASHLVRLLTYLPGTFLGGLDYHSPELLENFGRFLGAVNKNLETFHHPALYRYLRWDLKNAMDLEPLLEEIRDPRRRRLVDYFLQQFRTFVIPAAPKLRTGIIYNDANDYNVLTDAEGKQVTGIIDFGDMVHTYMICDLAIAAAYAVHRKEDPIAAVAHMTAGFHAVYPLTDVELEVLFHLICARLSSTLLIGAHQLKKDPDNEYLNISLAPALEALEKLITVNPRQANHAFRKACGLPVTAQGLSPEKILELRERHLGKSLSVSYKKPLKMVRGAMQYLYDHEGRAYLDTVNNVCHVGHCHPRVVKAAQDQMARLNTNTRYLHDNIVEYAQRLTATLPEPLSVCFLVCTGSEANELALRMARTHTGHTDFVVADHAYHGNTNAVIEISAYKFDGPGGKGCPPHVHKTLMADPYRGPYKADDPRAGEKYARDVQRAFKEVETKGRKAAAFIHESVPGVGGQIVPPDNYLENAYRYAREAGALCIADEVQVGFGRVGSHMWAFEVQGVVPDIVTMGKPIGNGHPLAAVVTTPEIADSFNNGMEYFNTFGGNPVSCAVGLAVLDVIRDEKLQENALETGEHFKARLSQLMDKHPLIGDVRGLGLFIGIELVRDRETLEPADDECYHIAERMKDMGILISVDGPLHNVLKIKPPIVFDKANADQYVDALDTILTKDYPQAGGSA